MAFANRLLHYSIMSLRTDLHNHPGVSGCEQYAHDRIVETLMPLNPNRLYDHVGGYGVIAVFGDNPAAQFVAFRADTDALPIGHRCGHDGHTAILLRFAQLLKRPANIILIFQPEEETGFGAQKILDAGILQQYNIRAIYGLHNLPGYPLGTVVLNYRTFAAASSGVVYHLQGRNTHASTPEKGINPGLAVAEIIQQMSQLNNAKGSIDDFRQSTLICVRVGEEAFGTSAGEAEVMFTLRAYTNDAMEHLLAEAHAIVGSIASRHGLGVAHRLQEPFRATENNSALVEQLDRVLSDNGVRVANTMIPFRWSEDFANYLIHFPGCFFGIGAGENHPELHHPDYDFPDALIEPAARVFELIVKNR